MYFHHSWRHKWSNRWNHWQLNKLKRSFSYYRRVKANLFCWTVKIKKRVSCKEDNEDDDEYYKGLTKKIIENSANPCKANFGDDPLDKGISIYGGIQNI